MNWHTVRVLLLNELRMLVRDRRTVVLAVVLPALTMPLILFATKVMNDRRARTLRDTTYRYAVIGSEKERLRQIISATRETPLTDPSGEEDLGSFKFAEVEVPDPAWSLKNKDIHFYLEALSGAEADALPKPAELSPKPAAGSSKPVRQEEARIAGVPLVRIFFRGDRDLSQAGRNKIRVLLQLARRERENSVLLSRGFPVAPALVASIETDKLATSSQVAGSRVGRLLTVFLVMFLLSGGAVVAMDSVAGEKERGSLETLLTTAAGRGEIVAAKQISILLVALVITVIQVANLAFVAFRIVKLPEDFVYRASPAATITIFVLFLPVAALIASVLLTISAYAKSYKEAQLYFFPVYLVSLLPSLAGVLPGIRLRSAVAVVPLANVSVAVREVMVGRFDWPMILLVLVAMTAAAAWTMRRSAALLSQERLVTASETDAADFAGGSAVFPKHVLRWYGLMGAVLLAIAVNVPQLSKFRAQVLFNELVLFLGVPLLMIFRYRLPFREALALRRVRPWVWLAVLLIIPSGNLVGIGVFRLANLVLPVPRQMLEQFSRDLLPKDVPPWQMVLLLSVLPGMCEEIAFRGTLLYGMRRRMRPVPLALAVGAIFGLFHVALFRLIPTAFMGIFLTAIALLTGSIFPCMLAHAGNNALAYFSTEAEVPLASQAWWVYAAALLVFLFAFFILYRNRTPYPGLKL